MLFYSLMLPHNDGPETSAVWLTVSSDGVLVSPRVLPNTSICSVSSASMSAYLSALRCFYYAKRRPLKPGPVVTFSKAKVMQLVLVRA